MDWYVDPQRPSALRELRHEIAAYLRRHAEDPEGVWSAEIAVEELVGNAVRHSGGPVWVSIDWSEAAPLLMVHDLGPDFDLVPQLPDDIGEGGRGLFLAAHLTEDLARAARSSGGNRVSARLEIRRPAERDFAPPRRSGPSLPALEEAEPGVGFPREPFLRALVVQLAQTVETTHGPAAAEAAVAQVGTDIGGQMEEEFRLARDIAGRLSPEQLADCFVRLKAAIEGGFHIIEVTPDRIVLGNTRCPFGPIVQRAPALCRMTSSVFGGIAARNADGATVVLEERIAVGDPGCRVVIALGAGAQGEHRHTGHHYPAPAEPDEALTT